MRLFVYTVGSCALLLGCSSPAQRIGLRPVNEAVVRGQNLADSTRQPSHITANRPFAPGGDSDFGRAAPSEFGMVPAAEPSSVIRPLVRRAPPPRDGRETEEPVPFLLEDAIDSALQNSGVIRVLSGRSVQIRPSTMYDPEILSQRWKAAGAVFDPQITAGYLASKIDQPPQSFFGPGIPANIKRDQATFTGGLVKKWVAGGTTSVSFAPPLAYLFYPDDPRSESNPIWAADLVFLLQQPLLRGAGIAANTAPVRIAQLKTDQSSWDVKQSLIAELRSVEEAYWTQQAALTTLQAYDAILPLLDEAVRIEELRFQSERVTRSEVARTRLQRSQFIQRRVRADADVRERELRLRQLIGLSTFDGRRLLPVNPPIRRAPDANLQEALGLALLHRPDLVQQRLNVQIRELELAVAKNARLPQLDLQVRNRTGGLGNHFSDALDQMDTFNYQSWTGGVTFSMPIGNRAPRAVVRAAEAQLARERAILRQSVQNAEYEIMDVLRELSATWAEYDKARAQVEDSGEWVKVSRLRFENPPPENAGQNWMVVALNDYQSALSAQIDAIANASRFLAAYNVWLARLEEAQGTLLDNRYVQLESEWAADDQPIIAFDGGLPAPSSAADAFDFGWSDGTASANAGPEPDQLRMAPAPTQDSR